MLQGQGKYEVVKKMNQQTLEAFEKGIGPLCPDPMRHFSDLTLSFKHRGEYEAAEKAGRRALEWREWKLGREHPDTIISLSNLAEALWCRGKYKEAEAMNRRALEWRNKMLGPEHPDTLNSTSNLAQVLQTQGMCELAEAMNRQVIAKRENVLGKEHPDTLRSFSNLADVLEAEGRYHEAEIYNRRALEGREKVLGSEHPDTLQSICNLAQSLKARGEYELAEAMSRRALEGREKTLGQGHPGTLKSISSLAGILQARGKYEVAEAMNRRALEGREKVLGREHPDTLNSISSLVQTLEAQGKYKAAEATSGRRNPQKSETESLPDYRGGGPISVRTFTGNGRQETEMCKDLVNRAPKYPYKPVKLNNREIRLLVLCQGSEEAADEPVRCMLVHGDVVDGLTGRDGEKFGYNALSYVWGNANSMGRIFIDGKPVFVRSNLLAALKSIRSVIYPKPLWVDALCINQDDVTERNHQVGMMATIYRNADSVLMWLGRAADDSDLAMDLISIYGNSITDKRGDIMKLMNDSSFDSHWNALYTLFRRKYWNRLWILQEVVLGSEPVLLCGSKQAHFLWLAALIGSKDSTFTVQSAAAKSALRKASSLWPLVNFPTLGIKGDKSAAASVSLLQCLLLGRPRNASVSVDYVYGILGLVDPGEMPFSPDYDKSARAVFGDVARNLIESNKSLDILTACKELDVFDLRAESEKRSSPNVSRPWDGFIVYARVSSALVTPNIGEEQLIAKILGSLFASENQASEDKKFWALHNLDRNLPKLQSQEGLSVVLSPRRVVDHDNSTRTPVRIYIPQHLYTSMQERFGFSRFLLDQVRDCREPWPSWIPDWSLPIVGHSDVQYLLLSNPVPTFYQAAGKSVPKTSFDEDAMFLTASGLEFDQIAFVGPCVTERTILAYFHDLNWYNTLSNIRNPYGNDRETEKAFKSMSILGRDIYGNEEMDPLSQDYDSLWGEKISSYMMSTLGIDTSGVGGGASSSKAHDELPGKTKSNSTDERGLSKDHSSHITVDKRAKFDSSVDLTAVKSKIPTVSSGEADQVSTSNQRSQGVLGKIQSGARSEADIITHAITDAIRGVHRTSSYIGYHSRVFVTKRGYFGRGPVKTEPNDYVCVFLGGRVPFVLRECSDGKTYFLLGECCKAIKYSYHRNKY
jgi:tetratricopeptide (TPR) repeat protein